MEGCVVTVGVKGSPAALLTTGGNSPLAEMRRIRCTYKCFPPDFSFVALTAGGKKTMRPPHHPHPQTSLTVAKASFSVTGRYQMGLSGCCLSVNAVSRHPATPCAELAPPPRRPCCGSRPQRRRCLISFPMGGKAASATPTTPSWISGLWRRTSVPLLTSRRHFGKSQERRSGIPSTSFLIVMRQ